MNNGYMIIEKRKNNYNDKFFNDIKLYKIISLKKLKSFGNNEYRHLNGPLCICD